MIDFNTLSINRAIMHSIIARVPQRDSATTDYSSDLLVLSPDVSETILKRLVDAAGKESRAFELEISNTLPNSFYDYCKGLKLLDNDEFISTTCEIADLLAESQKRTSIPGGYLIIIEGKEVNTNLARYIVIKAELHEALHQVKIDGVTSLEVLDQIFLSPSQKLYKIGALYEIEGGDNNIENFGCFIFDDQFRADGSPAEYFYKDFLGFSVGNNAKIQSRRFYDKTEDFIKSKITDQTTKYDLLKVLKLEFTTNQNSLITPSEFARTFMPSECIDSYLYEVVGELPPSFPKEEVLIKSRLRKKKIDFPSNINIIGPDENFDDNVDFIVDNEALKRLNAQDGNYTIIKIAGKPFS